MTLHELLQDVSPSFPFFPLAAEEVPLVTQDSRRVVPGSVFVCIEGRSFDGHAFAKQAEETGAAAIITQRPLGLKREITVPDTRAAYASLCQKFFGNPARQLKLIAVTGTNGKTTITSVLKQALASMGVACGLIGSIQNEIKDMEIPARFTTPEAWDLAALMNRMVLAGCTHLVMEASSQALAQGRLDGLRFDLSIFTNLTRDHLDYHGTMEEYYLAKKALFDQSRCMLTNIDDEWGRRLFLEFGCTEKYSYSLSGQEADFLARDVQLQASGVKFSLKGQQIYFPMPGEYSVYNALAVCGAVSLLGFPQTGLTGIRGVRGRCEVLCSEPFTVIRDFAHTGDGIEKLLGALRPFVARRMLVLYGCAGERDAVKRVAMSEAVVRYGDLIFLTTDNPRTEPPMKTITDALPPLEKSGKDYQIEPDRKKAIQEALGLLETGDALILCGKGHEDYQVLENRSLYFNERQIVEEWLATKTVQSGGTNATDYSESTI